MINSNLLRALCALLSLPIFLVQVAQAEGSEENLRVRFLVQMVSADGESCVILEPVPVTETQAGSATALQSRPVSCRRLPGMQASAIASDGLRYQVYFRDETSRDWMPLGSESARVLPILIPHAVDSLRLQGFEAKQFLRMDRQAGSDPVAKTELSIQEIKELLALIRGTSGLYLKASDNRASGRAVVSITAGEGLTGGTITNVGTISLETSGVPGSYYKVTTDKHGRVSGGSTALIESDIPVLRSPGKVSGDAIQSGTIGGSTAIDSTGSVRAASVSARSLSGQNVYLYNASNTNKIGLQVAGNLNSDFTLTLPASLPSTSGQVLTSDASGRLSWAEPIKPTTITVRGQRPIVVTGGDTEQPTISVEAATTESMGAVQLAPAGGTASGSVVQGNDPRLVNGRSPTGAAGGDLAGTYPNPTIAKLQGYAVQAGQPTNGQWLKFNSADESWSPRFVSLKDLKNATGQAQVPMSCTPAQTWNYNPATDQVECVNIAISHTAVSGLGNAATKNVGNTANTVAAGDDERFGNAVKIQGREVSAIQPSPAQVLTWNEVTQKWEPQTPVSAPVHSVAGRAGDVTLAVADVAGLGSAAVRHVPTTGDASAEQVVLGNDSRLSAGRSPIGAAGGDLSGSYPNPTVAKLQGQSVRPGTPAEDQWLRYSSAEQNWAPQYVGMASLKNAMGNSQVPTACTPAQTWNYNSISDQVECVNIGIRYTAVSGLGNAATKNVGNTANTVAAGDDARFGNALKLQGRELSGEQPAPAQVLTWNGALQRWEPQTPASAPVRSVAGRSGDVTLAVADVAGLGSAAVRHVPTAGDAAAEQVVLGNDSRLSGARPPTGAAGGDLTGAYPNPELIPVGKAGTYYRVRTDEKGRVVAGQAALTPADIPGLDWSHIVSGWPTTLAGYHIADGVRNAGNTPSVATGSDEDKGAAGEKGRLYVATDSRRIYSDSGSEWTLVATSLNSGGTLTSVTAGNGLLGGTITKSGVISADVGSTAGKLIQLDGSARLPAVDASQLTQLNASNLASGTVAAARLPGLSGDVTSASGSAQTSLAKLQGRTLSAQNPVAGQLLKFDGAQWASAPIYLGDLKSAVAGNLFPAPACSPAQTLTWSSVTDQFVCVGIAIADSAITYRSQSANTVFAAPDGAAGVPQFRRLTAADLPTDAYDAAYFKNGGNAFGQSAALGTKDSQLLQFMTGGVPRMTLDLYGNVGIGVATPQVALDVRGAVRIGNDVTCYPAKAGTIRWTGATFQGCDGNQWVALSSASPQPSSKPGYGYQLNKTNASYSTTIPWNDNLPASNSGTEVLTATITPTSANSLIEVNALVHYSELAENTTAFTLAAFQDANAKAFAAASSNLATGNCGPVSETVFMCQAHLTTVFVAGTTNPIVIRIRAGTLQGSWELNGAGGRKLGGALASSLTLREVLQ